MALSVNHSTAADGTFSATGLTAWDAAHSLTGAVAESELTFTDITDNDVSITLHGFVPKAPNDAAQFLDGTGNWSTPTASVTLDGILAAAADQAGIANADWNVRWNWAKTTNSEVAFEFGESAASTNGTSTSGVPNQVLAKFSTLAASTMSPLSVYSRAAHVFSVSPSAPQILLTNGSNTNPAIALAGAISSGWSQTSGEAAGTQSLYFVSVEKLRILGTGVAVASGTAAAPSLTGFASFTGNTGLSWGTNELVVSVAAVENFRFGAATGQVSKGSADAVAYAINARKSRGTVASPTVITTGDDLLTISGFGHVGATNTYQEACRITFDSTGTIADTTTGIGGIIRFLSAKVGAEVAEILRLTAGTTTGGGWATLNEADASPGTADLADGDEVAIYFKAGNICFAQNVGGAMKFLFIPIDGSTTTWTADGTGP